MLDTTFKAASVIRRFRSTEAGPFLDSFIVWLLAKGYKTSTIRLHLYGIEPLLAWAKKQRTPLTEIDQSTFQKYRRHLRRGGHDRYKSGGPKAHLKGAQFFIQFLVETGDVPNNPPPPRTPALLREFAAWLASERGCRPETIRAYSVVIRDLLPALGDDPALYTAKEIRRFVLSRSNEHGPSKAQATVAATRGFLRFLVVVGRCRPGLEGSVPTVASWKLSSLPKHLPSEKVERLIESCDERTPTASRDRAILLLLSRLGLRAGDVADLAVDAIDWHNGALRLAGKGRVEIVLPLPQDVGDAILHYWRNDRPRIKDKHVFLKVVPPLGRMTSELVSSVVRRAMDRAGVCSVSRGAHVLRHSAAVSMLNKGATLHEIAAVLRHSDVETTLVYAKVDKALLTSVAPPWPQAVPPIDARYTPQDLGPIPAEWPEVTSC